MTLADEGKTVASGSAKHNGNANELVDVTLAFAYGPQALSAENPYLYTVVSQKGFDGKE